MLVVTGSGDVLPTGLGSGLTEKYRLEHGYGHYCEDCKKVGVKYGPSNTRLPIESDEWETEVSYITKPDSSFYSDEMELREANFAYNYATLLDSAQKLSNDNKQKRVEKAPDITKPAEKLDPPPAGSFYSDMNMKEMDIRVANLAYYHGHTQKLIDDINQERVGKS